MSESITYCQNCPAFCGLRIDVEDGRLVNVRGDRDNPLSQGYLCFKGRASIDLYNGDDRVTATRRRGPDGVFADVPIECALDEIHESLDAIVGRHGPAAVALYYGTGANSSSLTHSAMKAWLSTVGSPYVFSSMTIDQSAKWVTAGRMGRFASGRRDVTDADVLMLVGINPAVSHYTARMSEMSRPSAQIREFRDKGGTLIVVDPRLTETARLADVHVQIRPGEDAALFAGLIRLVLENRWHDQEFCDRFVTSLDALRMATEDFTPDMVAARTGVDSETLEQIGRLFALGGRSSALTGTGANMGPHSNLVEHLIESFNAVCGGYRRSGDRVGNTGAFFAGGQPVERAYGPDRTWERGPKCRSADIGRMGGEYPTALLPGEIAGRGEDRIRALVVVGGNPVPALGDPAVTVAAFESLELLVTLDPRVTDTTELSHYHVATSLPYEETTLTAIFDGSYREAFAQVARPVVRPPAGVIPDWQFFWGLTRRRGITLPLKRPMFGVAHEQIPGDVLNLGPDASADSEMIVRWMAGQGRVSYERLLAHPHGVLVPEAAGEVGPAGPGDLGRLDLCPPDVAAEIRSAAAMRLSSRHRYLMINRRMAEVVNSAFTNSARVRDRHSTNPAFMNPDDMDSLSLQDGDRVLVSSDVGEIVAVARRDAGLAAGVISISHAWGKLHPDDDPTGASGAFTGRLTSITEDLESINHMPRLTAVPVSVTPYTAP